MNRTSILLLVLLALSPRPVASQVTERLYRQACDDGDMVACNAYGLMYELGESVTQDLPRAVSLYRRACEGGELVGCTNLGFMYQIGAGVTQDVARADGLYQVACEGGEMWACASLGGVEQNSEAAPAEEFLKSGRVGDAQTGKALSGAIIEVPDLGIRVISDVSGRFALTGVFPPGRYTLRAERAGYEAAGGQLEIPGNPEFLVLLSRYDVEDPFAPGGVSGRVTDDGGDEGLSDVDITVLGETEVRTLSNRQGRFLLMDLEPGPTEIRFTRLGYAPRTAILIVHPGRTVELSLTMSTQPIEIEPIRVVVRSRFLEQSGFYERADRGLGTYFTRDALDAINPLRVSDVFQHLTGVGLEFDMLAPNVAYAFNTRGSSFIQGPCTLPVYVDGVQQFDYDLNQIPADWIEGMEVYVGAATPHPYSRNSCGAVLLWTGRGR